ncbi:MAG TPA: DNA polymerase subunit beta [Methanoregulaceae archaeon]|nr:DNA polymerase subunit beta [Methanoregulaceae archaeon]
MNKKVRKPIRLRDFIADREGWIYAVSTYDNTPKAGCVLRYIPDPEGERKTPDGRHYHKLEFEEAYERISSEKPEYSDFIQRIPSRDITRVWKPEEELDKICRRNFTVKKLVELFDLPGGTIGCTGSFLCELENSGSDIDLVIYGRTWFHAQKILQYATNRGILESIDDDMWMRIYRKRNPEISFSEFMLHEKRKCNRGQIDGTYFDLLYTRPYEKLNPIPAGKGRTLGMVTIEAEVVDASLSHDNPAVYEVDHEKISRVLSFTHTYSGQALAGEIIQARGMCEQHGDEYWLVVGTTREAKGEFIRSLTLIESDGRA